MGDVCTWICVTPVLGLTTLVWIFSAPCWTEAGVTPPTTTCANVLLLFVLEFSGPFEPDGVS